ncbi:DUF1972 domain-containing protein [Rhodococcus fascians]|nr:DUF1972 domain-containing protein [Rhodococcus fascians]MBY4060986.1 DUF1972 domain-containing protein [Rhodococcus fascians]MBY4071152.1 DUF1972 domain-containing protein [Rhodococcus fascians]
MRKSVVIIGSRGYPSYYGGFETLIRRLAPYLADKGWSVVAYGRPGTIKTDDDSRDHRVRSVTTPGLETKSLSTLTYGLSACLHAAWKRPDAALVLNVANGFWLPILKMRGIPTVVNVDGMEWERAKWGRAAKIVFKMGARMTARFADIIVCDSVEIQRRWKTQFARSSDFIAYGADESANLELVENLQEKSYVLYVARFVPENSIEEFLAAAEVISERHKVVIVGSSGYGGDLDQRALQLSKNSENVTWLGHLSDDQKLFSLWQHCGAYFHGHSVGGTNPALVQAMALGAPIVARDTTYNREVLGDAGRFVEPDPAAIVKSINELICNRDEQTALGMLANGRATSKYSWSLICDKYEASLRRAIGVPIGTSKQGSASVASYSGNSITQSHVKPDTNRAEGER